MCHRAFNIGEFLPNSTQQALPPAFSAQEVQISTFFDECRALCMEILTLFAIGLKIPSAAGGKDFFASRHLPSQGPSGTTLRLLHYPSLPESADYQPEVDIRAGAHSDYGSITLLFQRPGQPGLEILTAENEWAPVAVTPPGTEQDPGPPILVNIGDLLDHWTRGLLRSTVHRVIFPKEGEGSRRGGEDRYSIAFFNHPAGSTKLEVVPSEMVMERKRGNESDGEEKIMTANEHLSSRLKATYLSLYSEKKDPA
jgi:isopenicillin N synthase-like dioxygenase